ncbi:uncharacterized protein [Amphiura filiformis]|uniref:uncharacterized protein n=1 Tax=Amphiura filiformis TaxID=82378 RepID=UPI003B224395
MNDIKEVFWTDSMVVLGYIQNDTRRFHTFVANRVQKIRDYTDPAQWRHVKTDQNPADEASRGISPYDLVHTSKWLTGPEFLWKTELPEKVDTGQLLNEDDPEVRRSTTLAMSVSKFPEQFELERLEYFSDWDRARRAIANCTKFKDLLKNPSGASCHQGGAAGAYREELGVITSLGVAQDTPDRVSAKRRNESIKKTSSLYRLDPFVDSDGLLRVGGRIRRAELAPELKHPVILPKGNHITTLLIRHYHEKVQHQGRGMTINALRASGYWITGASTAVSSVIHKCVKCRRLRSPCQQQKMSDLPEDRLEPVPPFTYSAVDYFGPFMIKEGRSELKRYAVLFTCMSCRAIHIETANSLTTDSFINALRRLLAIRGPIRQLRSDCGTNFIGAKRELQEAWAKMDHEVIRNFLLKENCDFVIDFKMNVPASSHMGGVWERQIRTARNILTSMIDRDGTQLNDESLRTLLYEAAAIVNCRPLTTEYLNNAEQEPLTPNHLLTMKSRVVVPPFGKFEETDIYSRKRWRRVQLLAEEFWKRWKLEYLSSLQARSKWEQPCRDFQRGDIVILKEDDSPRNQWQIARIEETYPSEDGRVRKVKVKLADKRCDAKGKRTHSATYLDRPIHKLVLLLENPVFDFFTEFYRNKLL